MDLSSSFFLLGKYLRTVTNAARKIVRSIIILTRLLTITKLKNA